MVMHKDPTAFRERFNAYKNGKSISEIYDGGLPKYGDGTIPFVDELKQQKVEQWSNDWLDRLLRSAGSKVLQLWNATGLKPQPESPEQYTTRRIKETTWKKPSGRKVIDTVLDLAGGDVKQAVDAGNAVIKGDYTEAGLIGAGLVLPSMLLKAGRLAYKTLRKSNIIPRQIVHDIISDPVRVIKDKINGEYAFTQRGRDRLLLRDNIQLSLIAEDVKNKVIEDEKVLRMKRAVVANSHGLLLDIMTDRPKDYGIKYVFDPKMNAKMRLGHSSNPIELAYYENPTSSYFKYKWDGYNDLRATIGHEFVHRLENDSWFSPFLRTSSRTPSLTGYNGPAEGIHLIGINPSLDSQRSLIRYDEVKLAFYPTINRYNQQINRVREANALGIPGKNVSSDDAYGIKSSWHGSPAEVVADLRGAIAAGFDEQKLYNFMWHKHGYDGDAVRNLRALGYKDGKLPYLK